MPLVYRSNIMKMLKDEAVEDRKIYKFPGPYKIDCTPYYKIDFSDEIYRKCLEDTKNNIANWLKISKVIVVGDVSVGKTSIVNRFCRKLFDCNYKSTIGVDFEVERFDILNVAYNLQIWDTAGQERFKSIAQSYYRGSHAIIVVFDLTNYETLSHSRTWLREALESSSNCPFIFLVGTKKDLLKRFAYKNMELSAMKFATKLNAEYWAVSSKTGKNIDDLFKRIAALTFDQSVKSELNRKDRAVKIGTSLVSFKKDEEQNVKNSCSGLQCIK